MARRAKLGKRVLILDEGGNWKGCGTALKMAKDGHQVIWCNLVSIFVICADRIPGALAILRSKGHQESGGVTKSVHR